MEAGESQATAAETDEWSPATPGDLADFIVSTHHAYLRRELPRLDRMIAQVLDAHAGLHPELRELRSVFSALKVDMETHMLTEEWVIFPSVRRLGHGPANGGLPDGLARLIRAMEHEHGDAGTALARIRELTNGYAPPSGAAPLIRALLAGLAEFETDLHHHIHRENDLLFPAALSALDARGA